ncbi:MAG TPA: hypothetical protein VMY88_05225 [Acidimicrobiales bacterium]|nr:hypothetical protein [Acidimicrobiales bacterium]
MAELSLDAKVVSLHDALDRADIAHAFGGAIALGYYAEPRVTVDIDVNVFVPVAGAADVAAALDPLGIPWDPPSDALERDGQCRLRWGRNPVDLFFEYDEVHQAFAQRSRMVPFQAGTIPVLAPEHLMVCKAVFDRTKDWLDLEQMMIYVDYLEADEVRRWLAHIVGTADQRYRRADELLARREPSTEPNRPIDWPPRPH